MKKNVKSILTVSLIFCLISLNSCVEPPKREKTYSKPQVKCRYCGNSFNEGEGYSNFQGRVSRPEMSVWSFCTVKCAKEDLRNS